MLLLCALVLAAALVFVIASVLLESAPDSAAEAGATIDVPTTAAVAPVIDAIETAETTRASPAIASKTAATEPLDARIRRARIEGSVSVLRRVPSNSQAVTLRLRMTGWATSAANAEEIEKFGAKWHTIEIDAQGAYSTGDLPLGKWSLRCELAGAKTVDKIVELRGDQPVVSCDFDLFVIRTFRVHLVDASGRPLEGTNDTSISRQVAALRIVVADAPFPDDGSEFTNRGVVAARARSVAGTKPEETYREVETSAVGRLWCAALLEGTVLASAELPLAGDTLVLSIAPDRLRAQKCSVIVHVRDAVTAQHVTDAEIELVSPVAPKLTGKSDAAGTWRAPDVVPVEVEFRVRAAGFARQTRRVLLTADRENRIDLDLARERIVSGLYRESTGRPASGSIIVAPLMRKQAQEADSGVRSGQVDAAGSFRIGDLAPGKYVLMDAGTYQGQVAIWVYDPERLPPDVQLVDLTLGSVTDAVVVKNMLGTR